MIPPLVTTQILQTTLHLLPVFSPRAYLRVLLLVLTFMIPQLTSLHHLPSLQKPPLHRLQILSFHSPPLLRQQSKLAYLASSQKYHLRSYMQVGRRGSGIIKREIERSMKGGKRRMRRKSLTRKPEDVNKTELHRASGRICSRSKLNLSQRMTLNKIPL